MRIVAAAWHTSPLRRRAPVIRDLTLGFVVGAIVGGILGLVRGLMVYPPTAWFAVLESGFPAAVRGLLVGASIGLAVARARGGHESSH